MREKRDSYVNLYRHFSNYIIRNLISTVRVDCFLGELLKYRVLCLATSNRGSVIVCPKTLNLVLFSYFVENGKSVCLEWLIGCIWSVTLDKF